MCAIVSWKTVDSTNFQATIHVWVTVKGSMEYGYSVGHSRTVIKTTLSREPGFKSSCYHLKTCTILFSPRCFSSLRCLNEYLAIDNGGYDINE